MPLIITGDFNLDISKEENKLFLDFMQQCFGMESIMSTPTTLGGTCIDLLFTRNVDATCMPFITYYL